MRAALIILICALLFSPIVLALGFGEAAPSSGSRVLGLTLAALTGAVVVLLTATLFGINLPDRQQPSAVKRFAHSATPMALTDLRGRLLWTNDSMDQLCNSAGWLIDGLADSYELDPGEVYRTVRQAESAGLGLVAAFGNTNKEDAFLLARQLAPGRLVWSILSRGDATEIMAPGLPLAWETSPIACLQFDQSGIVAANRSFREGFGTDPKPVADVIQSQNVLRSGKYLLPTAGGQTELFTALVGTEDRFDGPSSHVLLVPTAEAQHEEDAPSAGLDQVPVVLVQLDLLGRVLWLNKLARARMSDQLGQGASFSEVFESLGPPMRSLINAVASGAQQTRGEMAKLRCSEHDVFMEIELTRVEIQGQHTLFAVLTDANELRQLEEKFAQSQKMEAVGKLAGGVAHDFNNVLTAISGHSDLMLLGKDESHPDYSDLVQVRQNANRAAGLVRQLLAFSRKQTLNPEILNIQDVVSDTLYLLDRLIGEKINLVFEHGRDLAPIRADRQQLEQALLNLVVNARDAMPQGGTVTLSTGNRLLPTDRVMSGIEVSAGGYVEIAVTDEGTGIDPAILDKVFDPFFTTKAQGEGTGLGLSTVYGIVKQSGGFILAENREESAGAVFRILLPRWVGEDSSKEGQTVEAQAVPHSDDPDLTGRAAVLLVEDEAPVRAFASRALKLRGYAVTAAASAEEAMAVLADSDHEIDLIVSDVVMPGMDGPTFIAEARKMRPGLRVVFVSGYAEESFRKNLMDDDFNFLPKPFSLAQLTAKVKEVLERT